MRVVAVLILILSAWPAAAEVLSPQEASARAAAGDLTIVDVRLPAEWAETGLPEGAEAVSLQNPTTLEVRSGFVEDMLRVLDGRRDQPVALICARGNRSAVAATILEEAGFTSVHDISEGMIGGQHGPGWLERALPTAPCKVC
ncbi:MAG TPA: rhodanese-like domain-containing protein [Geminicoccaceae bacterium]|jgi:rhodanese-related sulfurtransferase|nr:rhodanese-like domain-containing protein [Geminicoccaceae bacterium]